MVPLLDNSPNYLGTGFSGQILDQSRKEGKNLLHIGKTELLPVLSFPGYMAKSEDRSRYISPAGIMGICTLYEKDPNWGTKTEYERAIGESPVLVHQHFVDLPKYEDGTFVPDGNHILEITAINDQTIEGIVEGRKVLMDITEGKPYKQN